MSGRKKPVFGIISLILILGLIVAGVLISIYYPRSMPTPGDDSLAVVIGDAANTIATLLIIGAVSLSSAILAGVGLLRRERPLLAALALTLSLSAFVVVILAVTQL